MTAQTDILLQNIDNTIENGEHIYILNRSQLKSILKDIAVRSFFASEIDFRTKLNEQYIFTRIKT